MSASEQELDKITVRISNSRGISWEEAEKIALEQVKVSDPGLYAMIMYGRKCDADPVLRAQEAYYDAEARHNRSAAGGRIWPELYKRETLI